jgi:hypothetical protein
MGTTYTIWFNVMKVARNDAVLLRCSLTCSPDQKKTDKEVLADAPPNARCPFEDHCS